MKFFHQKQLLSESKTHQDLDIHSLRDLFKQTEIDHLRSHAQMNFWFKIEKKNSAVKEQQVLDYMWVYIYKFMKKEMLAKCKIWLVVWEDQQIKSVFTDIYTVILVTCSFHVFMIMAAQFDLELTQYNIINVFVHANLNETVFMKMSDKYWKNDHILKLNKTLYELWRFSILNWLSESEYSVLILSYSDMRLRWDEIRSEMRQNEIRSLWDEMRWDRILIR